MHVCIKEVFPFFFFCLGSQRVFFFVNKFQFNIVIKVGGGGMVVDESPVFFSPPLPFVFFSLSCLPLRHDFLRGFLYLGKKSNCWTLCHIFQQQNFWVCLQKNTQKPCKENVRSFWYNFLETHAGKQDKILKRKSGEGNRLVCLFDVFKMKIAFWGVCFYFVWACVQLQSGLCGVKS